MDLAARFSFTVHGVDYGECSRRAREVAESFAGTQGYELAILRAEPEVWNLVAGIPSLWTAEVDGRIR